VAQHRGVGSSGRDLQPVPDKRRLVYIEGSLQTREWDDQEGNKRKTTEIRARDMVMLGSAGEGGGPRRPASTELLLLPSTAAGAALVRSRTTIFRSDVWFLEVSRYSSGSP